MIKITDCEPKNVFAFFNEIAQIPHGSGNTQKLAQYCLSFANERNLRSVKDENGNVIIFKNGTKGYERSAPVILQGHLDMVCEKTSDCTKDMSREGLDLCCDGEYLWADGTTLGGDDGIAVAYMLALLDADDIPHPPIEALFTNDEEIGLLGAHALDTAVLKGKRLINMDSEAEGILTVSCAGGVRARCELSLDYVKTMESECAFEITVGGLKGGHSGIDINAHRKNAHILLGRVFQHIDRTVKFTVASIEGGKRANVIPNYAKAVICTDSTNSQQLIKSVSSFDKIIRSELKATEPDVKITVSAVENPTEHTDSESTRKIIFTLQQIPNGIQSMSPDIPDMVQTSLNMGELVTENHGLKMSYLIRSNASTGKQYTVEKLASFIEYLYGKIEFFADYPVWEYRADSPLREIMVKAYENIYSDKPKVSAIHAGLECGILSGKINDADMVSFGPDLENVHTPAERMSIASAERCWRYLLEVLAMLK